MSDLRTTPIQMRSNLRIEQIAAAAKEAIAEHGTLHFTTNQVADRAGCSIGVIYRYFPDKFALLEYVYPSIISTVDQVTELGPGSVLLCKADEVFWLPEGQLERRWLAAGYDAAAFSWTDEEVAEDWGPLRVLRRAGVEAEITTTAKAIAQ